MAEEKPITYPANMPSAALDPKLMEELQKSCRLALEKQLNKNKSDPKLRELEEAGMRLSNNAKQE